MYLKTGGIIVGTVAAVIDISITVVPGGIREGGVGSGNGTTKATYRTALIGRSLISGESIPVEGDIPKINKGKNRTTKTIAASRIIGKGAITYHYIVTKDIGDGSTSTCGGIIAKAA